MKKLIGATLLIILFFCGGCKKAAIPKVELIINTEIKPSSDCVYIIILSDDEGDILFHEKEKQFTKTISISIEEGKKIHLTSGKISPDFGLALLTTYCNIASGFKLTNSLIEECDQPEIRQVSLTIKNVESLNNLFIGLGLPHYTYDNQKKELRVFGRIKEEIEALITVQINQDSDYKSYRIPYSEWNMGNSKLEIDYTDFYPATAKEIELDKEGNWGSRSKVSWGNGTNLINYMETAEPNLNRNIGFQQGRKIKIFTQPNLSNSEYRIDFWSEGYFEQIVGTLPEKVTLYDPFIEIVDASIDNFQANLDGDIEYTTTSFFHKGSPAWSVHQLNEVGKPFEMIKLPIKALQDEPIVKEIIDESNRTSLSAYQTNLEDIADRFRTRQIFRNLDCISYSKKTVSKSR